MTFIKLAFLICLFCFTAKHADSIIRTLASSKVALLILDSDSEKQESEKDKFENLFDVFYSVEIINIEIKKPVGLTFPFLHFLYSDYSRSLASPPPDAD